MKTVLVILVAAGLLAAGPALAQRVVAATELGNNPAAFHNSTIKVADVVVALPAGISQPLAAAGYTLNKYATFGLKISGIRCFVRRGGSLADEVGTLAPGTRVTVTGTLRQPVAKVDRAGGRNTERVRLERYVLEVSAVEMGWPPVE